MNYYEEIIGRNQTNFISMFNQKWQEEISSHKLPYSQASQIMSGNRLRPIILAWGYYANISHIDHEFILDFAICIELIHKASILLDDLIDNDNARHGLSTFHIEYSKSEAVLYAIFLIDRSLEIIYKIDSIHNTHYTSVLISVINNMAKGGIKEICSTKFFSMQDVTDIINLETTSLIENSYILGYQLSSTPMNKMPEEIYNIAHLCGYCFQVLNDIEPFSSPEINKEYKGSVNFDVERKRKNIVISYLYGACTKSERMKLESTTDFLYIHSLISKHKIINLIMEDIRFKMNYIKTNLTLFKKANSSYYFDFSHFLDDMFNICFHKCGLAFEDNFFGDGQKRAD